MLNNLSIIVIGGLNTDIMALGAKKLLQAGEHTYAEKLQIGAGGKSRNIAQMIATLSAKKNVAMVGKTSKDPYGLWKLPVESLEQAGVNTDYIKIVSFEESKQFPGIALIPVDKDGKNQIYVLPGITNNFLPQDIDNTHELFEVVAENKGMLVLTLELPYKTAVHAIKLANDLGIKVLFDPGGIDEEQDYKELLAQDVYLVKPNEHEAKTLTGVEVNDFASAKTAAEKLLKHKVQNVFITVGSQGGYFFNKSVEKHISVPDIRIDTEDKDETGCGDQTMAAFVTALEEGKEPIQAAEMAVLAGTIQFFNSGVKPVTQEEINEYLK